MLLLKENFEAERALMTDQLATLVSLVEWSNYRSKVIGETGSTPKYNAHNLTYYNQGKLFAAVDFSGRTAKADTIICGFVLWEVSLGNEIGLARFEQNVVSAKLFRSMPVQTAAQTMASWRCPKSTIESMLGVSIQ